MLKIKLKSVAVFLEDVLNKTFQGKFPLLFVVGRSNCDGCVEHKEFAKTIFNIFFIFIGVALLKNICKFF